MKKILVTGSSGFLAHHFIKVAQDRGYMVLGVDKRPIPHGHTKPNYYIQTNLNDLTYRDMMGVNYVVHFAWRTNIPDCQRHPIESTSQNIDMSIHMLELAREAGVKKFLFPSTASLYGNNPVPWTEDMTPDPIEPYSWQKLSVEHACKMYSHVYKLPTVIFRFFQVFGEMQRDDTALAAFLKSKKEGKPITLTETHAQSSFRSGQRDFIYAGDLAHALVDAIESDNVGNGEILNVASGQLHTMEEIANVIGAEVVWIPRRPYEVECHLADVSKIKELLNWQAQTDVLTWLT
jgi:UDP-glucose 4-epimerase